MGRSPAGPERGAPIVIFARRLIAVLAVAALGATPLWAAPARKAPAAPVARDWTKVVVQTPDGGFRMGNPAAPIKLVEYGSLVCPHCGHFEAEASGELLNNYVKPGRVSYEFRNFLLSGSADVVASLLSRCAGPARFFPMIHELFATQSSWAYTLGDLSAAEERNLELLSPPQQLVRVASITGLDKVAPRFGIPPARIPACLTERARLDQLANMQRVAGQRFQVQGTPTFVINGRKADKVASWDALKPLLGRPN